MIIEKTRATHLPILMGVAAITPGKTKNIMNAGYGIAFRLSILAGAAAIGFSSAAQAITPSRYSYQIIATTSGQNLGIVGLGIPAINDKGFVTYQGAFTCEKNSEDGCNAIWTNSPSGKIRLVASGGPGDGTTPSASSFSDPDINDAGHIAFTQRTVTTASQAISNVVEEWNGKTLAAVTPVSNSYVDYLNPQILSSGNVIYWPNSSTMDYIAKSGSVSSVTVCGVESNPVPSPNGWLAFRGAGLVKGVCTGPLGLYRTNTSNGKTKLAALEGSQYGTIDLSATNNAGVVAFTAGLPAGTNYNTLFEINAKGVATTLAALDNGQCTPNDGTIISGAPCLYSSYAAGPAINLSGEVALSVAEDTSPIGSPAGVNHTYVTLNGNLQSGLVAEDGMTIGDCVLAQVHSGPRAINNSGQITFWALGSCTSTVNPTEFVIVATPVP